MVVTTTGGDLGEEDISKPTVADVVTDGAGNVEKVIVKKGTIFTKQIEVPAARIEAVEPAGDGDSGPGRVHISTNEEEVEALAPVGVEPLAPAPTDGAGDLLDEAAEAMPTAEGLRKLEGTGETAKEAADVAAAGRRGHMLRLLGPGFLAGMAGNDSSAVTSYALDGARVGYGHLWLLLLATPLLQAVQFGCTKIGRIQQQGLADILRVHYGRRVALPAAAIMVLANVALLAADLAALGSGLELITGVRWVWFVGPVAAGLWYITVYQSFDTIKRIFLVLSLAFVTYLVTAVLARPDWSAVLGNTLLPHLDFGFASVSTAVALLGATISPYQMFWQVQGEKEEQRPGTVDEQMRQAGLDSASGVISGNLIAYAIMVATAATLFVHHQQIRTAVDAAKALEPVVGPLATYLFAFGLIGASLVAIPVLLASTSYAVSGSIGWPSGLARKPWQSEGFYLILTVALVAGLVVAVLGFDPIQLLFWANVLQGVLAPILVALLLLVGNNRTIMGTNRFNRWTNAGLVVTALLMTAGALLLFYGLATGQGS